MATAASDCRWLKLATSPLIKRYLRSLYIKEIQNKNILIQT